LEALQAIYPEHQHIWKNWKQHKPHKYWKSIENQRLFFDQLANKFGVVRPEDWYRVTGRMVMEEGGHFLSTNYKSSIVRGKQSRYFL
jgi:hypothetical protein